MQKSHNEGIFAALSSAVFLGFTPVFGKLAINFGFSPLAVVAFRTSMAAGLVFLFVILFYRSYLYIFPVGLLGCILAGLINGLGSILYYMALNRLNASIGIPPTIEQIADADIPEIARRALAEAHGTYPVPKYMSAAECATVVRRAAGRAEVAATGHRARTDGARPENEEV